MTTPYAVALILPNEVEHLLDRLRGEHASEMTYIKIPHITLKYPFLPTIDLGIIKKNLEQLGEMATPFTMQLNGIRYFEGDSYTVYVAIKDEEPVVKLHLSVLHGLQGIAETTFERSGYRPHITIGTNISASTFPAIKENLSKQKVRLETRADSLSLFSNGEDGKWQAESVFKLLG